MPGTTLVSTFEHNPEDANHSTGFHKHAGACISIASACGARRGGEQSRVCAAMGQASYCIRKPNPLFCQPDMIVVDTLLLCRLACSIMFPAIDCISMKANCMK